MEMVIIFPRPGISPITETNEGWVKIYFHYIRMQFQKALLTETV